MSKIVTFEQAKILSSFGFKERSEHAYCLDQKSGNHKLFSPFGKLDYNQNNNRDNSHKEVIYYSAPTVSEALDFIREEYQCKGIYISVIFGNGCGKPMYYGEMHDYLFNVSISTGSYESHPLAEFALLNAVLEYLEKGGNDVKHSCFIENSKQVCKAKYRIIQE